MRTPSPTPAVLNAIRSRIEQLETERAELLQILNQQESPSTTKQPKPATMTADPQPQPRNKISDEGRKRIADAAKKRWAKAKQKTAEAKPNGKKAQAATA